MDYFSQIVSSAQNVISAEVPLRLKQIADAIEDRDRFAAMSTEEATDYLMSSNHKDATMFRTFLLDYGHRGTKEFDAYSLQWEDDPSMLIQSLKTMISSKWDFFYSLLITAFVRHQ